jgi:hypothetical protein
MKEQEKEIKK